jgi:hypothetical protein
VLHAQDHAEHVGVEGGVGLRGLLSRWAGLAFGAGVVDGNVEPAEPSDGFVDQILHVALVVNVGADEFCFRTGGAKLGGQRFAGVIATAGNDDTGALLRGKRKRWRGQCRSGHR